MIYNSGLLYGILDKYIENRMEEEEHGFITAMKWPENYSIGVCPKEFWTEIQEVYEICVPVSDRKKVKTVGDLKRLIDSAY